MVTFELQKKKFFGWSSFEFLEVMTHYSSVKIALVFGLKNSSRQEKREKGSKMIGRRSIARNSKQSSTTSTC